MTRFRLLGTLALGVVAAMTLGGFAMLLRLTPGSDSLVPIVVVFGLVAFGVVAAVIFGIGDGPEETPYW